MARGVPSIALVLGLGLLPRVVSAQESQSGQVAPPTQPAPAQPPQNLFPTSQPDQGTPADPGTAAEPAIEPGAEPPIAQGAPGPPGEPLDVVPIPPLAGLWGYGAEVAAAIGASTLTGYLGCIPLVGPVLYALWAPGYAIDAIDFVARNYTMTGGRDPSAALVTAYVVHGVTALGLFAAQALIIVDAVGLGLLIAGSQQSDPALQRAGLSIVLGSAGAAGVLALFLPAVLVAGLAGPHIEVLAYRYYEPEQGDGGAGEGVIPEDEAEIETAAGGTLRAVLRQSLAVDRRE